MSSIIKDYRAKKQRTCTASYMPTLLQPYATIAVVPVPGFVWISASSRKGGVVAASRMRKYKSSSEHVSNSSSDLVAKADIASETGKPHRAERPDGPDLLLSMPFACRAIKLSAVFQTPYEIGIADCPRSSSTVSALCGKFRYDLPNEGISSSCLLVRPSLRRSPGFPD